MKQTAVVLMLKSAWSYTSTPQYAFMVWCLVKAQGQLYLYLYDFSDQGEQKANCTKGS
jgi:hypothetical protein